uniref:Uncharacterized protein n=1 Tax=Callorhinchus milii TaxID=7868 RepID=A0A4W3I7W6_CALMI
MVMASREREGQPRFSPYDPEVHSARTAGSYPTHRKLGSLLLAATEWAGEPAAAPSVPQRARSPQARPPAKVRPLEGHPPCFVHKDHSYSQPRWSEEPPSSPPGPAAEPEQEPPAGGQAGGASRDEERSYEEGTLVGRVRPFRREEAGISPLAPEKELPEAGKDYGRLPEPELEPEEGSEECCGRGEEEGCHRVYEEEGSLRVTFEWKGPYLSQWDSKYTNDPLEKSVIRALHGPWDPTIQETMKEVKLILHMWVGLFYASSSAVTHSSIREVRERMESEISGDLAHGSPVPVNSEIPSGPVTPLPRQTAGGAIKSSVIKRIQRNSNLVTSYDESELESSCAGAHQPPAGPPAVPDPDPRCDYPTYLEARRAAAWLPAPGDATIDAQPQREQESSDGGEESEGRGISEELELNHRFPADPGGGARLNNAWQLDDGHDTNPGHVSERQTNSVIKPTEIIQQQRQFTEIMQIHEDASPEDDYSSEELPCVETKDRSPPTSLCSPRSGGEAEGAGDPPPAGVARQSSVIQGGYVAQLRKQPSSGGEEEVLRMSDVLALRGGG